MTREFKGLEEEFLGTRPPSTPQPRTLIALQLFTDTWHPDLTVVDTSSRFRSSSVSVPFGLSIVSVRPYDSLVDISPLSLTLTPGYIRFRFPFSLRSWLSQMVLRTLNPIVFRQGTLKNTCNLVTLVTLSFQELSGPWIGCPPVNLKYRVGRLLSRTLGPPVSLRGSSLPNYQLLFFSV